MPSTTAMDHNTEIKTAADLRNKLDLLLGEHLVLAGKATGAALGGKETEFSAYGSELNKNGSEIGDLFGSVAGDAAKSQFNSIWSAHNGFFVDYTKGVAAKDEAMKSKAVNDLTNTYVPQFTDFVVGATGLPKDTVTQLTTAHVTQTKAVVDAQAAKDWPKVYSAENEAYEHMQMIGDPIAKALAAKFPSKFPAQESDKASDLRVSLNQLLQAHLYFATFATDAALGGRTDEFSAAGNALNTNGTQIGAALGSLYGKDAETKFNSIWSAHNGFFVDYTKGVAAKDEAMKSKAVNDLTNTYVPQFTDFVVGATGLPKDTVTQLTTAHVTQTKAVVDAQGSGNWTDVASSDVAAGRHMQMIGDALASAIVTKFPEKFTK